MMGGTVAIDTNFAIDFIRGKLAAAELLLAFDEVRLPAPVAGELLFGAQNSGQVAANLTRHRQFIASFPLLLVDAAVTEHYAEIRFALKKAGQPIPENDTWIAAVCRANELPLITRDAHFARVPGLLLVMG